MKIAQNQECFNTQPPEGGWVQMMGFDVLYIQFQHTAARRRLANQSRVEDFLLTGFNTQPPEGGWKCGQGS